MTAPFDFGSVLTEWAVKEPTVSGLVLIGSRERAEEDAIWRADCESDWDFHLITSKPNRFLDSIWTKELNGAELRVYAARMTRIGSVPKVNAIFENTEVDLVIIPSRIVKFARILTKVGWHRRNGKVRQFLQDLAVVVRPGYRFLKDTADWGTFYKFAIGAVTDARLNNDGVRRIADGFVCDYIWTVRKISRGELFAAQRMLHRELMETNFKLLHELKLRRGERSFPEARRIERIAKPEELAQLILPPSALEAKALLAAVEKSAQACRELTKELVGEGWAWPTIGR
jgi:hypothetical protein